jgi:hypothetical protein
MLNSSLATVHYDGVHCSVSIQRPATGIALLVLAGSDIGEFGDFPMRELAKDLHGTRCMELFIDAGAVRGASIEVSSEWMLWLKAHSTQFRHINMLTGSRYIQITAEFVRRFSGLIDRMTIFTDRGAFGETLSRAIGKSHARLI